MSTKVRSRRGFDVRLNTGCATRCRQRFWRRPRRPRVGRLGRPRCWATIIRRVRVDTEALSTDPRSRRRRTIDRDQLALVLEGAAAHGWATSFIVTNLPTGGDDFGNATDVEAWFRMSTDIEDRIREAKLGAGLIHLPSGYAENNTMWTWAALIAGNLSTLLQALRHRHRRTGPRPRRPVPPPDAAGALPRHPPRPRPHPATTPRTRHPAAPGHGGPARAQRLSTPHPRPPDPGNRNPPPATRHPQRHPGRRPTPTTVKPGAPTTIVKINTPNHDYSRIQV